MPITSERKTTPEEEAEFKRYAAAGLKMLGLQGNTEPVELVAAVDSFVDAQQRKPKGFVSKFLNQKQNNTESALALGIVWGNQVVREFGWEWICVTSDGHEYYVVAPADRSLAIYATYFIKECLDFPTADCTAMLSFNMMLAKSFPPQPAGSYTSVMPAVRRLIPKGAAGAR
jgi:hypothetical protein